MKRISVTTLLAGTALVLAVAGSPAARADSWGVDGMSSAKTCGQKGAGTGDWEVSFGTRGNLGRPTEDRAEKPRRRPKPASSLMGAPTVRERS
jgi:hypothetical protein